MGENFYEAAIYWSSGYFDKAQAQNCKRAVEFLINEMICQHLDGYI